MTLREQAMAEIAAEDELRAQAVRELETESRPDYDFGDYMGGAAKGATLGGAAGFVMGGPVGALTGAVGGGVGEMASMGLEEHGVGGYGQFGGSMAADLAMSALTRKPTAGLVRRIPGGSEFIEKGVEYLGKGGIVKRFLGRNWAAESTGYAQRQAGKLVTDLPSPAPTGTNPAAEVGESVRSGHQMMDDVYQSARAQAEKETMGTYGSSESLRRKSGELLEQFSYMDEVPQVLKKAAKANPEGITLREAENIRRGVGTAWSKSQYPQSAGGIPHYSQMAEMYGPLDDVLEDIATHSPRGERGVAAVEAMRDARKAMHKAAPEGEQMFRHMIGDERLPNAQKALDKILSSDMAVAEVKKIRGMMGGVADDIALRRAAVVHMLQRRMGVAAEHVAEAGAGQSGGAMFSKASTESMGLTEILGERGFNNVMDILADMDGKKTGLTSRIPAMSRYLLIAAGTLGAGQADSGMGVAVLGMGALVEAFLAQNGKQGVAKLAHAALLDADIYRIIAMGADVNNAQAAAVRLGQSLIRRGLMTEDELGGDD